MRENDASQPVVEVNPRASIEYFSRNRRYPEPSSARAGRVVLLPLALSFHPPTLQRSKRTLTMGCEGLASEKPCHLVTARSLRSRRVDDRWHRYS